MLDEPKDHAVTGGRDESLRCEGGHSPEHQHSGIGDHRRATGTQNFSDQTSQTAEHVVVDYFRADRVHLPRTINHEVAQCCVVVLGEARNEPRSRKLPQSDPEEEAQTEPQPKSQW